MWVTGDFNLPISTAWNLNSVEGNAYPLDLCNMLIDIFNAIGSTYMVDSPTRGNSILDLFATNRPGLIHKVKVNPGLSDHEVITIESSLATTIIKSKSCTPEGVFVAPS